MESYTNNIKNKYYLMLCEIHYPGIHGKTDTSDPNIESHYLVYDRFDPNTGISLNDIDEDYYETDDEYDLNSDDEYETNKIVKIEDSIKGLKNIYLKRMNFDNNNLELHPTIRNYFNIISRPNYIKPEIGEYIILPTQEAVAILKTFWLRIIQKKWKKVFRERSNIIIRRSMLSNLLIKETNGQWPDCCLYLPGLRGMLSDLKR